MKDFTTIVAIVILTLVIIAVIGIVVYCIKTKKSAVLKKMAYYLVVQAEAHFGSGTGPIKYTWVVEQLMKLLPPTIKRFITEKDIDNAIEFAVEKLKVILKENPLTDEDKAIIDQMDADEE